MTTILDRMESATPRMTRRSAVSEVLWSLPGLGPLARVETVQGPMYAQALRRGDQIRSDTGRAIEIVEIERFKLDSGFLGDVPDAQPVLIRAGALGNGLPRADVVVSPGQLVGAGTSVADIVFRRARDLLGRPGITRRPEDILTYTVIRCGASVVAEVEGIRVRLDA